MGELDAEILLDSSNQCLGGDFDDSISETESVMQLRMEDRMDQQEMKWNLCVQTMEEFFRVVSSRKSFFVDMLTIKVVKPRRQSQFGEFFDGNWRLRHYRKESAKVADETLRKAIKSENQAKQRNCKPEEELSPQFKAPSREVTPFQNLHSQDGSPLADKRTQLLDIKQSEFVLPQSSQSHTYRLETEELEHEVEQLKRKQNVD